MFSEKRVENWNEIVQYPAEKYYVIHLERRSHNNINLHE